VNTAINCQSSPFFQAISCALIANYTAETAYAYMGRATNPQTKLGMCMCNLSVVLITSLQASVLIMQQS
jgi:hypothetical protein